MAAIRFTPGTVMTGMIPGSTGVRQPSASSSSIMRK